MSRADPARPPAVVGLILKANDPGLIAVTKKKTSAAASPFVRASLPFLLAVLGRARSDLFPAGIATVAIERAEIRVLP